MYLCNPNRGVEQQVARRAHNPKVAGSSPVPATRKPSFTGLFSFLTLWIQNLSPMYYTQKITTRFIFVSLQI